MRIVISVKFEAKATDTLLILAQEPGEKLVDTKRRAINLARAIAKECSDVISASVGFDDDPAVVYRKVGWKQVRLGKADGAKPG
jgi:hypothetical protein